MPVRRKRKSSPWSVTPSASTRSAALNAGASMTGQAPCAARIVTAQLTVSGKVSRGSAYIPSASSITSPSAHRVSASVRGSPSGEACSVCASAASGSMQSSSKSQNSFFIRQSPRFPTNTHIQHSTAASPGGCIFPKHLEEKRAVRRMIGRIRHTRSENPAMC